MRKTIYATLAFAGVMAITLPTAAQADEVCFSELSNRSVPSALVQTSVTSPEPGAVKVAWQVAPYGEQRAYSSVVVQIHEGSSYYFKEEAERSTSEPPSVTFHVGAGVWSVTAFARWAGLYGYYAPCHSPIQSLGSATVAAAPTKAARRIR